MTAPEDYLDRVRRSMAGMDPAVRDDILRELRSHIADSTAANGGNLGTALSALGGPEDVGRRYRTVYGYGRVFKLLFLAIAFALAVPSVPVFGSPTDGVALSLIPIGFLALAAGWAIWVSVHAGFRAGLGAGLSTLAARFVVLVGAIVAQPANAVTVEGLTVFFATSAMLVAVGWLPGTAKKIWTRPGADL